MLLVHNLHFVSDEMQLSRLMAGACARVKTSLRAKTRRYYELLIRNFVAFCICLKRSLHNINLGVVLAYLKYLVENNVSVHMVSNNISAIRASLIMYGLDYLYLDHPRVRYFVKALKINRPLAVIKRNVMSLDTLKRLTLLCDEIQFGFVFKPVFLIAFFGFLCISNLAPHFVSAFDPSRNITIADVTFHSQSMQIAIKWPKTLQYRDKVHTITLPKLKHSPLCPVKALKATIKAYNPKPNESLFQVPAAGVWQPLIDSRIKKVLSKLKMKLGVAPNHYTFHSFQRSGATLAYNAHMHICPSKVSSIMAPGRQIVS